jgi:hypothetical protein
MVVHQDKVERIILDGVVDADDYYASKLIFLSVSYARNLIPDVSSVVQQPSRYLSNAQPFL